jgi:predicted RNA polymerase sigma factor
LQARVILLEQQNRSLWNRDQIAEGISLTESALRSRRFGAYTLQEAIAAVHAESSFVASTGWRQITLFYDQLLRIQPSPIAELNRAVAVAICEGLEQGLRLIDELRARVLSEYAHPNWAGTVLLYSDTDKQTAITDFGQYMRNAVPTKVVGAGNLSAALRMFQSRHNRISDLLPSFIGLCEADATNPQKPD